MSNFTCYYFLKWANPGLFLLFWSFQIQFYRKIVELSFIRTQVVRVEGHDADQSTTTTTYYDLVLP